MSNKPTSLLLCARSYSLPREASCQPVCKQFSARASLACCYNVRVMECGSWTVCLPSNCLANLLLFLMKNVDFVGGELWARGNDCNGFVIASPSPPRPILFPHNIASVGARETQLKSIRLIMCLLTVRWGEKTLCTIRSKMFFNSRSTRKGVRLHENRCAITYFISAILWQLCFLYLFKIQHYSNLKHLTRGNWRNVICATRVCTIILCKQYPDV